MFKKLLTITFVLSSVLFSMVGHSKTMIEMCSDCSAQGGIANVAKSAFGWNSSGEVYVLDASNEKAYKYSVYVEWITEGPDRYAVHRANQLTLTQEEKEGVEDLFKAIQITRNTIRDYIENTPEARLNTRLMVSVA